MSDEKDKQSQAPFELDWDDALSDWERDVDTSAQAKSNPMPQKPVAPPSRALYQPPDLAEIARLKQQKHASLADEGPDENTVMAQIPSIPRRQTAPAPANASADRATQRPAAAELDLDDLLANLDEETRFYAEAPKAPPVPPGPAGMGPAGIGPAKVAPPPPKLPRPAGPPAFPTRPRSPLLKSAGGPPPPRPPLPRPVVAPPRAPEQRDSFSDDVASFEQSLRRPGEPATAPPPPDDEDLFILPDEEIDTAGLDGEPPPPVAEPIAASAPSSAPTPIPPSAFTSSHGDPSSLDADLDEALGLFEVGGGEPSGPLTPEPRSSRPTPAPSPTATPASAVASDTPTPVPPVLAPDSGETAAHAVTPEQPVAREQAGPERASSLEDELFGEDADRPSAAAAPAASTSSGADVDALLEDLDGALPPIGHLAARPASPASGGAALATSAIPGPGSTPPAPVGRTQAGAGADRGAQTARRTVRSRKPRREVFPLVGRQEHAVVARAELLEHAALRAPGPGTAPAPSVSQRARALLSAAELRLQLGELDAVSELATRAAELDPSSIAALRLARAVAASRGDIPAVGAWLEREAALHDAASEKSVLFAVAADAWARAGETDRAATAARAAYDARASLLSSLVSLSFSVSLTSSAGAFAVLRDASAGKLVPGIAAHAAVRAVQATGELPDEESASVPGVAIAALASSRVGPADRVLMFDSLAAGLEGELAEVARTISDEERARAASEGSSDEVLEALRRLGAEASRPTALALALEPAIRSSDAAQEGALSERLAAHVEGTERAALLGRASMLLAAAGDLADAEALLRAASMADSTAGVVAAARTRLSDLDPVRRAQQVETEGALVVAARLGRDTSSTARESELLERALERTDAPPTADVLSLDVAAELTQDRRASEALRIALRRTAHRAATAAPALDGASTSEAASRALGLYLAGALSGDADAARDADAAVPSTTTARARALLAASAGDGAAAWSDEAARSSGLPMGRASREAARALLAFEPEKAGDRLAAAAPDDLASAALFAVLAERGGDYAVRAQAIERYASLEREPAARARDLIRAAMAALAAGDGTSTRALLARASADAPEDPILDLMRWRDATGNGSEVPLDVAARRAQSASGEVAGALAAHTDLVTGAVPRGDEALGGVAGAAREEARRRAARLEESRRPVPAPESVAAAGEDLGSLRALERSRMASLVGLDEVELALAGALDDVSDRAGYLRLAYTAALRGPASEPFEQRWLELASASAEVDPWLARRVAGLAARRGASNIAEGAGLRVAESLSGPLERGSAVLHAFSGARSATPARERLEVLRAFHVAAPEHPLLAERIAEICVEAHEPKEAAPMFEQAARAAAEPQRRARLHVAAADLYDEHFDDPSRVVHALEEASKADVTYGDVFERLRTKLERLGEREKLSGLVARRLAAGGEGTAAVELFLAQSSLRESSGDLDGARQALRSALEQAPEHLGALKKLAQLSLAEEDYRGAAEALIRLAKLRREVDELRWVFFELAGIYDRHIPDVKRAEAAYKRVLKLVPDDTAAMDRLAGLYRREDMLPQAIEQLEQLLKIEMDPDRSRGHRLVLARIHEQAGDARRAEQTLEMTRRASPTDLETLRALADFYGRQNAQTALAMHLNRAAQDFRHALSTDLADEAAWLGLVEVLTWRGRHDAACAAASAATAMGIVDVEIAKLVDATGAAPACTDIVRLPEVEDAIAPAALPAVARQALALLGAHIDKAVGFDPRSFRAEKLPARDPAVLRILEDVGAWLGVTELEVWVAPGSPRVCLPFGAQHPALLVGREVLNAPDAERQYLTARALFIAKHGLSGVLRAPVGEIAAMLASVAQHFDPSYQPIGVDPGQIQEQGRKLAKQAPRKALDEAGPLVFELVGLPEYDAAKLAMAVSELGDRIALLSTGSMPAALSAIFKLAGEPPVSTDVGSRAASIRRSPEALSLIEFAVSEPYFEARRRSTSAR